MSAGRGSCVDVLRGGLSWPGVVVLWTGLWTLLNTHVPGGTGVLKELGLSVVGACMMVWTRTLFSNAGMDSLDYEGSLSEMGSLLAQGSLRWRDKAKFYARSFLAIVGSILFWDGVYTLCDEHTWEGTLMYNSTCAALGGAGMVWVMTSEDGEDEEDEDGIDGPPAMSLVGPRAALQGKNTLSRLSAGHKGKLYAKALFCNICGVVFWKGVQETIEDIGPDTVWTGLGFFAVGIFILLGTERLSMNSGLVDGLPLAREIQQTPSAGARDVGAWESNNSTGGYFADGVVNDAPCPEWTWLLQKAVRMCVGSNTNEALCGLGCEPGCRYGEGSKGRWPCCRRRKARSVFPRWVTTAMELTGVVFAWTGIEWYVWEGDYFSDTLFRDLVYIAAGLGTLICTGTFFNLAGTISPVAALKQVHEHNRHEDGADVPLLFSSEDTWISPETP